MSGISSRISGLRRQLLALSGIDAVIVDETELQYLSSDVYSAGTTAAFAIKPTTRASLPQAIKAITAQGFAVVPRGGGMSYTSGYTPVGADAVILDLSALDRIVDVSPEDMTITVEAGVTWEKIHETLQPLGLRLPFFGTFSGSRATVGGGMSNGALFMGTARHGTAAEIALGFEIVTAEGRLIRTGQSAFSKGKPFYRTYGPDLTGLFVHDAGALGIKTLVTMRLLRPQAGTGFASFVFDNMIDAAKALSAIAVSGATEEAYVFDPEATSGSLDGSRLRQDVKRLLGVVRSQGVREGIKLVGAGRNFLDKDLYSLHVVCAGSCEEAVESDLRTARKFIDAHGGGEIANSIPKAVRSNPFEPLNSLVGPKGERWVALNCKVAHSDAIEIIAKTDDVLRRHADAMQKHGVWYSCLCIAISNHAFSFEPVLRWHDSWLPVHRRVPEPGYLAKLEEPPANRDASKLVDAIRTDIVDLFAEFGAASNQIGKTYRYFDSLNPETARLVLDLKRSLDPDGLMNPGALGLRY